MSGYGFNLKPLIIGCVLLGFCIWGIWEVIDLIFIDEVIKSTTPITPEIELKINDNVVDTIYVYRKD